jgi:hypothetical protein
VIAMEWLVGKRQSVSNDSRRNRVWLRSSRARSGCVGEGVEVVHRPAEVEVGVCVEAGQERCGLVVEVALDFEVGVEAAAVPVGGASAAELRFE